MGYDEALANALDVLSSLSLKEGLRVSLYVAAALLGGWLGREKLKLIGAGWRYAKGNPGDLARALLDALDSPGAVLGSDDNDKTQGRVYCGLCVVRPRDCSDLMEVCDRRGTQIDGHLPDKDRRLVWRKARAVADRLEARRRAEDQARAAAAVRGS